MTILRKPRILNFLVIYSWFGWVTVVSSFHPCRDPFAAISPNVSHTVTRMADAGHLSLPLCHVTLARRVCVTYKPSIRSYKRSKKATAPYLALLRSLPKAQTACFPSSFLDLQAFISKASEIASLIPPGKKLKLKLKLNFSPLYLILSDLPNISLCMI